MLSIRTPSSEPSMSTFHRFRQDARIQAGLQLQEQKVELLLRLILHWDGRFGSALGLDGICLLYTSPSPRDLSTSRMPSSA